MSMPYLPAFAWPGGYPLRYIAHHALSPRIVLELCPACAAYLASMGELADAPTAGVAWEGEPGTCDECACDLPTAYGPVRD